MSTEPRADARVVTRAVGRGPEVLARVTERVRALRELSHPGVLTPLSVGVADGDQVVVTAPWVDGVDLAELESRRGPLSAGECVWLGVRVAAALEALHARGIAHGDIAPANVVVSQRTVVLVDTVGGCLDDERGTLGFRAPERREGPTPATDAYSLGALLRWCVATQDSVPIEAWTAPLVVVDSDSRPPVQVAARALASCAPEREIAVPARSEVVSALRARATERTERLASGRPWRVRRVVVRAAAGMAVAAAAVGGVMAVPLVVDAAIAPDEPSSATQATDPGAPSDASAAGTARAGEETPRQDPGEAAAALTTQRIAALAAGDGESLLATVGSGPLAESTAVLANALDDGLTRYEGLAVEVRDVVVDEHSRDTAIATVTYGVTDHRLVTAEGTTLVPAYEQSVELALTWDGRWTVERAQPAP
ncbi:MAG: protein kinase domain-containing protein [Demequina sp.]